MSTVVEPSIMRAVACDDEQSVASVDAAQRLLRGHLGSRKGTPRLIDAAAGRARSLAAIGSAELGPLILLSEVLPGVCLDDALERSEVGALVDATAELARTPRDTFRLQLAHCVAGGRPLLGLPPEPAIDTALRLLFVLAPVRQVSLWQEDDSDELSCCSHAGQFPSKRTAALARRVLEGDPTSRSSGLLVGVPVAGWEPPVAALMARPEPRGRTRCEALMRQFAPFLGVQLERRSLTERAATTERRLAEASERRLSRLAFDIHDGPLQNVAGIAGDLAMLRQRLREALPDTRARVEVLGCVDDLDARLRATDTELRDLSHSLESPSNARVPFIRMLHEELEAFARRTDIRAGIEVDGDFHDLTESQRIALWRIVQESLTNAREHSSAREVRIKAFAAEDRLQVEVVDDGRGFNVNETLLDAARRGRLGLVGVSERVRLLGGRCDIRSAPGGPTIVAVTLPRWRPQT